MTAMTAKSRVVIVDEAYRDYPGRYPTRFWWTSRN